MVRAKFKVEKVSKTVSGGEILLNPVTSGGPENESFFKWTPYGNIMIGMINEEVLKQFVPGAEMYVDFTPVDTASEKQV